MTARANGRNPKLGHVRVSELPIADIRPSPENEKLYRPVLSTDPEVIALADSIRKFGVKINFVVSADNYIISGHRRYVAAQLAGLSHVPCIREPILRSDPRFLELLREYNRQRVKTADEIIREEIVSANSEEAHRALVQYRTQRSRVNVDLEVIQIKGKKRRCEITQAKKPMFDAVLKVLRERREFLPLTLRQIHYALLNNPPLRHASKPSSLYKNDTKSYKSLSELLLRARLVELIPWDAIEDGTKPVVTWACHQGVGPFVREHLDDFLKGYWRNLQQSQPHHVEIIGEKNTVESIIRPIASEYCIPYTLGRGYSSGPPRQSMLGRFRASGKDTLVLLVLSDFDPEGEDIGHSFARSMRDEFGIKNITPIKVGLTHKQVLEMNLPPRQKAKEDGSRRKKFVEQYGDDVHELEAVPPAQMQGILRDGILSVMDVDALKQEIEMEKEEEARLAGLRRRMKTLVEDLVGEWQ